VGTNTVGGGPYVPASARLRFVVVVFNPDGVLYPRQGWGACGSCFVGDINHQGFQNLDGFLKNGILP
jgi:hypothetical protein